MSKGKIILISIILLILVAGSSVFSTYNTLVSNDEAVSNSWANIQAQYQRRSDLIPNLVNVVKGYAKHESETLQGVVSARAKATQISVSAENLTPEKMRKIQAAQGELTQALGKLLSITENYPELKANQNFSELQAQLEGTENRINVSRQRYNETVQTYNLAVRRFPANIVANMFGFEKKSPFEADASAQKAPSVEF